jgi:uncharacterized membrane protein YidH (DUF202 family)
LEFTTKSMLIAICVGGILLAGISPWLERRQFNRRNVDRPGLISWPLMQILGVLITVVAAALALKA